MSAEEFDRVMPLAPTPLNSGTGRQIHPTPEWTHPDHKVPSYILCIPLQMRLAHVCEGEVDMELDGGNLHLLKLHLLSLGPVQEQPGYQSDEDERDDDEESVD
jgi:hypothetical protein